MLGIGIIQGQRLLKGKQVLFSPTALQGFRDVLFTGADVHVLELRECLSVALTRENRADDPLSRLSGYIGDDLSQLNVHLSQGFLHVLHVSGLIAEQHLALARHTAQRAEIALGPERASQQAKAHQLL